MYPSSDTPTSTNTTPMVQLSSLKCVLLEILDARLALPPLPPRPSQRLDSSCGPRAHDEHHDTEPKVQTNESTVGQAGHALSLIHISEPTRRTPISYAVFCLKKKKTKNN